MSLLRGMGWSKQETDRIQCDSVGFIGVFRDCNQAIQFQIHFAEQSHAKQIYHSRLLMHANVSFHLVRYFALL